MKVLSVLTCDRLYTNTVSCLLLSSLLFFFLPQLIHRHSSVVQILILTRARTWIEQALSSICLLCLCKTRTVHTVILTGCKLTLSRKEREMAKVKTNTREEIARPTRALQTSTRARTVVNLDTGRKTSGIPVEERMTVPHTEILAKARVNTQAKGKANTWTLSKQNNLSLLKQPQPCRILRKTRVLLDNSRAFQAWKRGSWV